MKPLSFLLAIAILGSCASQTVYLSQLRDSDAGSQDSQAYETLQEAVALANDFLANSPLAKGYPAEDASFDLGLNNIILRLKGEYDLVVSIKRAYWGDLRFVAGEDVQADADGIVVAMSVDDRESDAIIRSKFLLSKSCIAEYNLDAASCKEPFLDKIISVIFSLFKEDLNTKTPIFFPVFFSISAATSSTKKVLVLGA